MNPSHLLLSLLQTQHPQNPSSLQTLHKILTQLLTNPQLQNQTQLHTHFITSCTHSLNFSLPLLLLRHHLPNPALYTHLIRSSHPLTPPLHSHLLKLGLSHIFIHTALLHSYSKTGSLASAHRIFSEMPQRDVVANNAMISALTMHGLISSARELFNSMHVKNSSTYNTMITSYCKADDITTAREIFDSNPVRDVVSWNAMIDGYCRKGEMEAARELFYKLGSAKNSITWNTLIRGYVDCREFSVAVELFREMQGENVRVTEVTMVSVLSACAHLGALSLGKWIHGFVRSRRLKVDVVLGNALIDMYFKCGSIEAAIEVFEWLPVKNVFCWNSVIAGLGMNGYGEEAIGVLREMDRGKEIKPDGITFVALLCACSHSGLVDEGKKFFSQMSEVYGIEPTIEHYGCMVDILGRAGQLEEALCFLESMPIQPNCVVWGSLFRACRTHRNTEVGERVTRHLLALDPNDGGNYVFLSNIYALHNRWDDVETCRKIMMERGVRKIPGCSSIEIKGVVHEFVVGDTSHPEFKNIQTFLGEINIELRKLGYQPGIDTVLHDIEAEEKENAIIYHSEKIAIAFGLMSTSEQETIRVMKNLTVCRDCHEATKLMTKLFQREIIVRDRQRFHHFRDGICSCKDYW